MGLIIQRPIRPYAPATPGVAAQPGCVATTLTSLSSRPQRSTCTTCARFAVEYATWPLYLPLPVSSLPKGSSLLKYMPPLVMTTTRGSALRLRSGKRPLVSPRTPKRYWQAKVTSTFSAVRVRSGSSAPALHTRQSILLSACCSSDTARSTSPCSDTSAMTVRRASGAWSLWAATISWRASSAREAVRHNMYTRAPRENRCSASTLPSPELAPVTTITRPASEADSSGRAARSQPCLVKCLRP
mmetsp:Transcript_5902/g.15097  ORF Transcript_5902/g.15097 Transcript_5902/m.15097 type:complete len:243 (+) Transcript_5902:639-1367(+)